jgi:hypothetical protein
MHRVIWVNADGSVGQRFGLREEMEDVFCSMGAALYALWLDEANDVVNQMGRDVQGWKPGA